MVFNVNTSSLGTTNVTAFAEAVASSLASSVVGGVAVVQISDRTSFEVDVNVTDMSTETLLEAMRSAVCYNQEGCSVTLEQRSRSLRSLVTSPVLRVVSPVFVVERILLGDQVSMALPSVNTSALAAGLQVDVSSVSVGPPTSKGIVAAVRITVEGGLEGDEVANALNSSARISDLASSAATALGLKATDIGVSLLEEPRAIGPPLPPPTPPNNPPPQCPPPPPTPPPNIPPSPRTPSPMPLVPPSPSVPPSTPTLPASSPSPLYPGMDRPCVRLEPHSERCFVDLRVTDCLDRPGRSCLLLDKHFFVAFVLATCELEDGEAGRPAPHCFDEEAYVSSRRVDSSEPNITADDDLEPRFSGALHTTSISRSANGFSLSSSLSGCRFNSNYSWNVASPILNYGAGTLTVSRGVVLTVYASDQLTRVWESPLSELTPLAAAPPSMLPAQPVEGCIYASASNYDSTASFDSHASCRFSLEPSSSSSCCKSPLNPPTPPPPLRVGCTDSRAYNFDNTAQVSSGVCQILGCTDSMSPDYSSSANFDDATCELYRFYGCTDSHAWNYRPVAQVDRNCKYEALEERALALTTNVPQESRQYIGVVSGGQGGCTSTLAQNYNSSALEDDGTCVFVQYGCVRDSEAINWFLNTAGGQEGEQEAGQEAGQEGEEGGENNGGGEAARRGWDCYTVDGTYTCSKATPEGLAVYRDEPSFCIPSILGCSDPAALNYAPDATVSYERVTADIDAEFGQDGLQTMLTTLLNIPGGVGVPYAQFFYVQIYQAQCRFRNVPFELVFDVAIEASEYSSLNVTRAAEAIFSMFKQNGKEPVYVYFTDKDNKKVRRLQSQTMTTLRVVVVYETVEEVTGADSLFMNKRIDDSAISTAFATNVTVIETFIRRESALSPPLPPPPPTSLPPSPWTLPSVEARACPDTEHDLERWRRLAVSLSVVVCLLLLCACVLCMQCCVAHTLWRWRREEEEEEEEEKEKEKEEEDRAPDTEIRLPCLMLVRKEPARSPGVGTFS